MLIDEMYVAEWFNVKSPSLVRYKEGDLPLLNFSNLTCMVGVLKYFIPTKFGKYPSSDSVVKADSVFQYIYMI